MFLIWNESTPEPAGYKIYSTGFSVKSGDYNYREKLHSMRFKANYFVD